MGAADGFDFTTTKDGSVQITHRGRPAAKLRGEAARHFLEDVAGTDPQALMARVTGNYRRGNERLASLHPRNRTTPR